MKNTLKKVITIVSVAVLSVMSLAGCGIAQEENTNDSAIAGSTAEVADVSVAESASDTEDTTTDLLDVIKERGYIIVGTEGTWSPYTYHDEEGNLVGFEVEVAQIIADYIGVDVQYSETVWSSIFASLDAGQIDIIVNGVSYTDERAEKYDFSEPYNYSQYAILTLADNDEINGLEDISGKIAANNPTSTIGLFAEEYGAEFDDVEEMAQSISEVLNGRADLTLNTVVSFADYLKQHPENEDLVKIITVTDPEPNAYIPVVKGNDKLVEAINEALEQAKEDGTLSALALKYFDVDTTQE